MLRTRGRWPLPQGPRVAIVGARRPTPYGEAVAERLATELARAGVIVVGGLALGIEAAAHEGALLGGGVTVAVLETGVDVIYPAAVTGLADRIVAGGGALVSGFPDGARPQHRNFPRRNETMAALAGLVVVVEAGEGSNALITVDAAVSMGKTVMAVPGSVFSPLSVGCHKLLRDGAGLVQNVGDVLTALSNQPAQTVAARRADGSTLDSIACLLDGREWHGADDLDAIASLVRQTGREVRECP